MLEVLTWFGESIVLGDTVTCNSSIDTNQSSDGGFCNIAFNTNWTQSKCETDEQGSCVIPGWFFIVMAAFQGILLLILGGCLLVGWKYVTSQSKREHKPDFVPTRGQSNDYTPDDGTYLQPSFTNQGKEPPCIALSVSRTDQETYDRVPVRGESANKRGKAKVNIEPEENVTHNSEEHYDFPSKIARHV